MFKVGDLAVVTTDMTMGGRHPSAPKAGDVVQIDDVINPGFYAVLLLRTGQRSTGWDSPAGWVERWFEPLPLTPSNKDNDHEPTSR